jgi:hypothetical protein
VLPFSFAAHVTEDVPERSTCIEMSPEQWPNQAQVAIPMALGKNERVARKRT